VTQQDLAGAIDAQQLPRARIALADPTVAAEHQDTVLHLLDHALADHGLVVEIDATLTRQRLVGDHPSRQQAR
jgi:hypothetical protein